MTAENQPRPSRTQCRWLDHEWLSWRDIKFEGVELVIKLRTTCQRCGVEAQSK